MLQELRLQNYLLVPEACLSFGAGLNVILGETGSGKSILLDSIIHLFSSRLTGDLIRSGQSRASLEASFSKTSLLQYWLESTDLELSEESDLVSFSREIGEKGSKARLDGTLIPSKILPAARKALLSFHGQGEEEQIFQEESLLALLDERAEDPNLLTKYKTSYKLWSEQKAALRALEKRSGDLEREKEFLAFQLAELVNAKLTSPDEEELLQAELNLIGSKIQLKQIQAGLEQTATPFKRACYAAAKKLEINPALAQLATRLKSLDLETQDLLATLSELLGGLEETDKKTDQLNERIHALQLLRRKYNQSDLSALIARRDGLEREKLTLDNFDYELASGQRQLALREQELAHLAQDLSAQREKAAQMISQELLARISGLGLERARVNFSVQRKESFCLSGRDRASLLFSSNPGEKLTDVLETASGGELSRLALGLHTLSSQLGAQVLLFDEIDRGTSGRIAERIGCLLAELATRNQIICVTHQPLIACFAERIFKVSKSFVGESTAVEFRMHQKEEEIVSDLGELISGEGEEDKIAAYEYAKGLREKALQLSSRSAF